jgi:methionyl-tRNA formyltransferase
MRVGLLGTLDHPALGAVIQALLAEQVPISAVILDGRRPTEAERRRHAERTGARLPQISLEAFERQRLPLYLVRNHASALTARLVRELALDLLVDAGTPRVLGRDVVRAPVAGVLSCHAGLLPRFRGPCALEWAVSLDEPVGNTVHFVDGLDYGPVLMQEPLHFDRTDGYVDVWVKVLVRGYALLARGTRAVVAGGIRPADLGYPREPEGRYFGVIDADTLARVMDKLARGAYAYQRSAIETVTTEV